MTHTPLDQTKADAIAGLFFDPQIVSKAPLESRHLSAEEAMQRMQDQGYAPGAAHSAKLILDRFIFPALVALGGEKFRAGGEGLSATESGRHFYLGIKVHRPDIDLTKEAAFQEKNRAEFARLLLEDFNRPRFAGDMRATNRLTA